MRGSHRSAIAALVAAAAIFAAGCGSSADDTDSGGAAAGEPFVAEREAGIRGDLPPEARRLWRYDTATGRYVAVAGDASGFRPDLRRPARSFTLAYMDPWASSPFAIPIREGVEREAKRLGLELIYCDAAFKADKAVECAELLARQRPAFAVAGNWQAGAADALMRVFDEARVPTASIDVWQPNSIFYGADNYTSGEIAGRAAGAYAQREWNCEDVWLFMGENKEEGKAADQRLVGFADGVQSVCGTIAGDRIHRQRMAAATGDQALTVTTDWLTAHPQAEHVLAVTIDDPRAAGIAKAIGQSGRDGQVAGMTCDDVGVELTKQGPASETNFLGCVAFFPERAAEYLVGIALDVVEGKAVPEEVHLQHEFLTHENIGETYP